jgi:lincosamide nucleotidyltransferase
MSGGSRQERLIAAVRARCEQDDRVQAALMYGSFPKGEGDAYSDVEFYLYIADDQLASLDQEAWVAAVAPTLAFLTNEYGTRVAFFEDLVRGEFHFEPHSRARRVSSWEPVERPGRPEQMILVDRVGELTSVLAATRRRSLTSDEVQEVYDRLLNWWLLGIHVLKRGERARAGATLAFVHSFLLQLARASEGSVDHWLTPSRGLELEISSEAQGRYAACHADLAPGALESAYRSAFSWAQELAVGLEGIDARAELGAKLRARFQEWFPEHEPRPHPQPLAHGKHDGGWRTRSSRQLFRSQWFGLRQDEITLPGGEEITYTVVEHPGYAMVVPLLDDGRVILERVYRHTVKETLLECPSGGLDGDEPEAAARRELREETGFVGEQFSPLGSFYGSDGISDERFHLFLATGLRDTGRVDREPTEQIELELMPLQQAAALARAGGVEDAPSALALILAEGRRLGGGT